MSYPGHTATTCLGIEKTLWEMSKERVTRIVRDQGVSLGCDTEFLDIADALYDYAIELRCDEEMSVDWAHHWATEL